MKSIVAIPLANVLEAVLDTVQACLQLALVGTISLFSVRMICQELLLLLQGVKVYVILIIMVKTVVVEVGIPLPLPLVEVGIPPPLLLEEI